MKHPANASTGGAAVALEPVVSDGENGDTEARQVLVIGVPRRRETPQVAGALMGKLRLVLAAAQFIDVLPFESGAIPAGVREAGSQIFAVEKKAWWRIW